MSKASLYKINDGLQQGHKTKKESLAKNLEHSDTLRVQLKEQHPDLEDELNDPEAKVPAYVRFQKQDTENCILRDDIKMAKENHFRVNYGKELEKPKHLMEQVDNDEEQIDGTSFFEMKYFLTGKQVQDSIQEKEQEILVLNNEIAGSSKGSLEELPDPRSVELRSAATILPFDHGDNSIETEKQMDRNYANG